MNSNGKMKISAIFLMIFLRLTNCLNFSADNVYCVLLKSSTEYVFIKASEPELILKQPTFNPLLPTVFISPGSPTQTQKMLPNIEASYVKTKRYNVVYFDSCYYTCEEHNCDYQMPGLFDEVMQWFGKLYGSVISKLIELGLPVESIELVGHSWGAGVAFLAANNTIKKLPLLVGLDPVKNSLPFHKGIADYTIVMHSNIGQYGQQYINYADSDLIANDGTIQPKCTDRNVFNMSNEEVEKIASCSHRASFFYWLSMIANPDLFYGVECNQTDCNYNNIQQLGPNLRAPGTFYFKTSKSEPYGLGMDAISTISIIPHKSKVISRIMLKR
ncbi:pancreatic lipase-related protein 2-like [Chrysoperla carnea]|uniref:pancreatic lipase-related protein 2-like n=1 Tax=Chrysoperla carnea TaxID=189513 RepID=UPI001D098FBC|nr:pancreatic lipase-related protein 2-like [Chrysoperla carnea]